jgi:chromate transport protein ChrA
VVLRILLSLILSVPGLVGLVIMAGLIAEWGYKGFDRHDPNSWGTPFFTIVAMVLVALSVVTIAVVLRFARWKGATKASLALTILAATTILIGSGLFSASVPTTDFEEWTNAFLLSVIGLVLASVLPFLHWKNKKDSA